MTNEEIKQEQIKQKALAYATENYGEYDEHDYTDHSGSNMCYAVSEKAFIAGAHSRDEEIKELKLKLANKSGDVADIEVENALLKIKLNKLSNPWISVDERLPEENKDDNGYSVKVIGMFGDGYISDCFCSLEENIWFIDGLTCDKPKHWMQIPDLK